jgi:hypothetical protein
MKASENRNRNGKSFLEYRCKAQGRERTHSCDSPASVTARGIEEMVVGRCLERIEDYWADAVEITAEISAAEGRLLAAETELDAALEIRLADALGGADADRYLRALADRRRAVDTATAELASMVGSRVDLPGKEAVEAWADLPLHDRRRLLRSVLDCVFVRRGSDLTERIHFCWRGESPEVPRPGRRWLPIPFDFPA